MKRQTVSRGHTHHWFSPDLHVDVTDGVRRGKKTQGLTSCIFALSCFHKQTPSCSDDEEHHRMELRPLIDGHLNLRQSYQLADNCQEAETTGGGDESCGSGAEDGPVPVTNKPRPVLLRKSEPFEEDFMAVTVTGFLTMKPISSLQDTGARFLKRDYILDDGEYSATRYLCARFLKRDYILDDGQYAATFMNLKTLTYVAVNQESQVHLCQLAGDPQSCRHPCLFVIRDTGTTELLPTETPGKYLGYRDNMVEVTDHISSFNMLPAWTDTLADHRDHAVRVWGLKATTSRVEPDLSIEDFNMAGDYHVHKSPMAEIHFYHQEHHDNTLTDQPLAELRS